jgi:signal peptidase I
MSGRAPSAPRPLIARAGSAVATAALVAFWVGFAPTSVGGDVSYAVVQGDSMRPRFDDGDIVILRRDADYGIGDVVAYHDPRIGQVFHRIIGTNGDRFVVQGDNRTEVDPFQPQPSDIIGREIAVLPHGFTFLLAMTSMRTLVPIAIAMVVVPLAYRSIRPLPVVRPRRRPARLRRPEIEAM